MRHRGETNPAQYFFYLHGRFLFVRRAIDIATRIAGQQLGQIDQRYHRVVVGYQAEQKVLT